MDSRLRGNDGVPIQRGRAEAPNSLRGSIRICQHALYKLARELALLLKPLGV